MTPPNATCFSDDGMCVGNKTALANPQLMPLAVVLSTVSLATVGLNVLVLVAVRVDRKLHTVGNLYIVSLSAADLLVGAVVMPMNILYLLMCRWSLGRPLCLFWLSMDYVASTASIFSVFILCVDRYRSVREPLGYLRHRTKAQASVTILGAWVLAFLWIIPILGWKRFGAQGAGHREDRCETDFYDVTWFKVMTAMVNFYVPTLLMLWLYARIYRAVRRHIQHRELVGGSLPFCPELRLPSEAPGRPCRGSPWQVLKRKSQDVGSSRNPDLQLPSQDLGIGPPLPDALSHWEDDGLGGQHLCLPLGVVSPPQLDDGPDPDTRRVSNSSEATTLGGSRSWSRTDSDTLGELGPGQPQVRSRSSISLDHVKAAWKRLRSHSRQYLSGLQLRRQRKAARQLGCIMAAFILCWIPYFVFFMVIAFCQRCCSEQVHMVTIWLGYLNSTLNPLIYPLCNDNFRKTFRKILHLPS